MSTFIPTVNNFSASRAAFLDASKKPGVPTRYVALCDFISSSTTYAKEQLPNLSTFTGIYTEFDAERNQIVNRAIYENGKVRYRTRYNPTLGFPEESCQYDDNGQPHGTLRRYNPIVENHIVSKTPYVHGQPGETTFFPQWPNLHQLRYKTSLNM